MSSSSTTPSGLNIHLTTFNAGREEIQIDYFASSLYTSLPTPPLLPPDILVVSLQELAPIGFAFLGGTLLAPYFSRVEEAVRRAVGWMYGRQQDGGYELLVERSVGLTGIMVFVRRGVKEQVRWMQEAGVGCGVWEMGNKGAVGVRIGIGSEDIEGEEGEGEEEVVTFVSAHLAPGEEGWERRNQDWEAIVRGLVFEDVADISSRGGSGEGERQPLLQGGSGEDTKKRKNGTLFSPPSHIFFAGDLNYRTSDTPPDAQKDPENWPQPNMTDSDTAHFSQLLKQDQLTRELKKGNTLHNLSEQPITFPPTYKYSSKAMKLAEENAKIVDASKKTDGGVEPVIQFEGKQEQVWLWAKHRIPSWCDRILYLENSPPKKVHTYAALPIQPTSDHRPVVLSCTIPRTHPAEVKTPFKTSENWKAKRAAARRYEFVVGLGAYLTLTGQGEALLAGTIVGAVGGYFVLAAVLGYV